MLDTGSGSSLTPIGTGASITDSNFFIIDSDDNGNPITLSFGSNFAKSLSFDTSNDWFNLSDRLNLAGDGNVD